VGGRQAALRTQDIIVANGVTSGHAACAGRIADRWPPHLSRWPIPRASARSRRISRWVRTSRPGSANAHLIAAPAFRIRAPRGANDQHRRFAARENAGRFRVAPAALRVSLTARLTAAADRAVRGSIALGAVVSSPPARRTRCERAEPARQAIGAAMFFKRAGPQRGRSSALSAAALGIAAARARAASSGRDCDRRADAFASRERRVNSVFSGLRPAGSIGYHEPDSSYPAARSDGRVFFAGFAMLAWFPARCRGR